MITLPLGAGAGMCRCGNAGPYKLTLQYRYPRPEYLPEAVDPWYVHGSWPRSTCGSPACEAEEYAELLSYHPDADISVHGESNPPQYLSLEDDE